MGKKIVGLSDKILKATIRVGAKNGATNISTLEVAKKCNISEMPIFKYFQTKKNLLKQAFLLIDKSINKSLAGFELDKNDLPANIERLWSLYFDYLIEHKSETKYYESYRSSYLFDYETAKAQIDVHPNFLRVFAEFSALMDNELFKPFEVSVIWDHIISNTLRFAVRVIDGQFPKDDAARSNIFKLIFYGIISDETKRSIDK